MSKKIAYSTSNNKWERISYHTKKVGQYLESLSIPDQNALWDWLHIVKWHEGLDPVQWTDLNNELVEELIKHGWLKDIPKKLKEDLWGSLFEQTRRTQLR